MTHMGTKRLFSVKCSECRMSYEQFLTPSFVGFGLENPIRCCGACGSKKIAVVEQEIASEWTGEILTCNEQQ